MGKKRTREERRRNSIGYDALEAKNLLAGDLMGDAVYEPANIVDPFADNAVTVEQIIERAQYRPYKQGELIVAIESAGQVVQAGGLTAALDWELITGIEGVSVRNRLLSTATGENSFVSLIHLDVGDDTNLFAVMEQLDSQDMVMWSSLNFYQNENPLEFVPNDPLYGQQYHHSLIQNEQAWDFTLGDPSIIIAVTDDGIETNHPDLQDNIWRNTGEIPGNGIDDDGNGYIDDFQGYDFVSGNNDPNPEDPSQHTHGTHVSGIAAADTDNGIGVAGTAGNATLMALQFFNHVPGDWTAAVINESFTYAVDNGAHIVTTSYNVDGWVGDPVVTAAYQYIWDSGAIHFNSAGNGDALDSPRIAFEQTLLVASTEADDTRSTFSNYGSGIDIAAPGGNILSTVTGGGYDVFSGTSMASPNAAGVAALIWSQNPTWTRDQVVAQLLGTADNIDNVNPGFEGQLGAGRVNPFNAFTQTLRAPRVTSLSGLPGDGATTTDLTLSGFDIRFDQFLDPVSVNDSASFSVVEAGADEIHGTADDVPVGTRVGNNYAGGSNSVQIDFDGPLNFGNYRLTVASGGIQNPFGTPLDGDANGSAGGDYSIDFTVATPDPQSVGPVGSLVYERPFTGSIATGIETVSQFIDLDAGQALSLQITGEVGLTPRIAVRNPAGVVIGQAAGIDNVTTLNMVPVETAGRYTFEFSSDSGTSGFFRGNLLLNSAFETESDGSGDNDTQANAQDLDIASLTFGDSSRSVAVGDLPVIEGIPVLTENFDNGTLGPGWTTGSSNSFGRIQLTGAEGTAAGAGALILDSNTNGEFANNEAIWTVDLTTYQDALLSFSHMDLTDESHPLPDTFTGSVDGDGVSISDDGITWHTILNTPDTASNSWRQESYVLADLASQFGLTLGSNFQIKFQQYDNFMAPTDGRGYDEVVISVPDTRPDWFRFTLEDGEYSSINIAANNSLDARLYDAAGNLLQTGVTARNLEGRIEFTDSTTNGAADTYFLELAGSGVRYSILVTTDSVFDLEPNDTAATAIDITDVSGAFGHVSQFSQSFAEPDSFNAEDVLDNVFPGVTLSNNGNGGSVYAALAANFQPPTGTLVFAANEVAAAGWREGGNELRADFDILVNSVSIDVGSDDAGDVAFLRAYDSADNLLEEVISSSVPDGGSETLTINRAASDIAYIIAAGAGADVTPLDNLTFAELGTSDTYSLDVSAGDAIDLQAIIPGLGPYFLDNGLDNNGVSDLVIQLFDPNGNLVATDNNGINETAALAGTYIIQIGTSGGGGEYYLGRSNDDVIPVTGIDFGPAGQPIAPGFAAHASQAYDPAVGYGWTGSAGLNVVTSLRGNSLVRDFATMRTGTFVADVDNGAYDVTVFLGVIRKTDFVSITVEGANQTFDPANGPNVIRTFSAIVNDGQLTFDFDGLNGLDNRIKVSGLQWTPASPSPFTSPGGKSETIQFAGFAQLPRENEATKTSSLSNISVVEQLPQSSGLQLSSSLALFSGNTQSLRIDQQRDVAFEAFDPTDEPSSDELEGILESAIRELAI